MISRIPAEDWMIIPTWAEIGKKMQESMYESSEVTKEGTTYEIRKDVNGSVVDGYAKLLYLRVWICYTFRICLQHIDG